MSNVSIMGYQMSYPRLTDKLQKENLIKYCTMLYNAKVQEARRGMIATRINKANSKGTKITYSSASAEDFDAYCEKLNEEYKTLDKQ